MKKLGRKFWIAVCSSTLTVVLLGMGWITNTQWIDVFKWILITFVAGNVGEHFTKKS